MLSKQQIKQRYPLHSAIFLHDQEEFQCAIEADNEIEKQDPAGLTPLQLCAIVGNTEAAEILLEKGANPDLETGDGWSIVQECVASGNLSLAQKILDVRERLRAEKRATLVRDLLTKLSNAPDFYCEMKWDFTSWVPLVARMCPSDTYKIYKSGPAVRIDSTLTGFDQSSWKRGNVTFMFLANESGCEIYDINHESRTISLDRIEIAHPGDSLDSHSLSSRVTSPLTCTRIKTDNVEFAREKAGWMGFRTDKTEEISGYDCSVFSTSGVEIITRDRVEHLTPEQRDVVAASTSMFESLLSGSVVAQTGPENNGAATPSTLPLVIDETESASTDRSDQKLLEYFNTRHVDSVRVRPKEQTDRVQKFKARVWLSNNHPLSLQEQLLPIVELMSTGNAHFSKLKDFITLQLPAGFPVNIEIPLYHMINARITFSNINSATSPVDGVLCLEGPAHNRESTSCVVDALIFQPPPNYTRIGSNDRMRQGAAISEDQMLQYAIQQSMLEGSGGGYVSGPAGEHVTADEDELTWMEALSTVGDLDRPTPPHFFHQPQPPSEDELTIAMRLSVEDEAKRRRELEQQEEADLARIIALSLNEK